MNRIGLRVWLPLLTAAAVAAAGVIYVAVRHAHYQSTAEVVLAPSSTSPADIANLTSSFNNSATLGTYVELLSAVDPRENAGTPKVTVSARGIPDTREIVITTTGQQAVVQGALQNVLTIAQTRATSFNDGWSVSVLRNASAPAKSGPKAAAVLIATAVLALLGAVIAYVLVDRDVLTARRNVIEVG